MTDLGTIVASPLEEVAPPKGAHGAKAWALWIARRLGLAILTLWLVSVLVFVATAMGSRQPPGCWSRHNNLSSSPVMAWRGRER